MLKRMITNIGVTIKDNVKMILGHDRYLRYYLRYRKMIGAYYILTSDLRKVLFKRLFGSESRLRQQILVWDTLLPPLMSYQGLIAYLNENNLVFNEGGFSIYIPPQDGLGSHLGEMMDFYPPDAGYKVVKDFSSPDQVNYVKDGITVSWQEAKLVANPFNQVDAATTAEVLNLSPRLYDLVELRNKHDHMTCFVVRHIDSKAITSNDVNLFLDKLDAANELGIINTAVPYKGNAHSDFLPPTCNDNLVKDNNDDLLYVDFQQFVLLDEHKLTFNLLTNEAGQLSFGSVHPLRNNKPYLYQTVPGMDINGRRDSMFRWVTIKNLLASADIYVEKRLVLDICCNSGVMSSYALSEGAYWALGWDLPEVVDTAIQIQRSLGFTRVDLVGAILNANYSLLKDIAPRFLPYLNEAIVFYLAAWGHISLISELTKIQWRALVFEGHERIKEDGYQDVIEFIEKKCKAKLTTKKILIDGDSEPRLLLIFTR